jgi:hypothetical protein
MISVPKKYTEGIVEGMKMEFFVYYGVADVYLPTESAGEHSQVTVVSATIYRREPIF